MLGFFLLLFFLLLLVFARSRGGTPCKNNVLLTITHVFELLTSVYILASPVLAPDLISNVFNITHVRLVLGYGRA